MLIVGGLGARGVSSARCGARAPAWRRASGLAMSVLHHRWHARLFARPADVRAGAAAFRARVDAAAGDSRACWSWRSSSRGCRRLCCIRTIAAAFARCARTRGRSALLYAIVVLRTLASLSFATFVPVMLTRRGVSVGQAGAVVAMYLFASGVGGFFGGPAADRFGPRRVIALVAGRGDAVSDRGAVAVGLDVRADCWRSAGSFCSRRCRSTSPSASRSRRSARRRCRR